MTTEERMAVMEELIQLLSDYFEIAPEAQKDWDLRARSLLDRANRAKGAK